MSEETRKILEMLREGKIGVDEAEKLMAAVSSANVPAEGAAVGTGRGNTCASRSSRSRSPGAIASTSGSR